MRHLVLLSRPISNAALASLGALLFSLHPAASAAKTPDGAPPSQETACSALSGAAFGLCNAYCEAQDCDVHPRPSCAHLRANFEKLTGSAIFPCDVRCGDRVVTPPEECDPPGSECREGGLCLQDCSCSRPVCGNGVVERGEECDPPGSACGDGGVCADDCTCAQPVCGNGVVDPGEECDPPASPCADGSLCTNECTCGGPGSVCCQCETPMMMCSELPPSECLAQNCRPVADATCDPSSGSCGTPPPTICCQCSSEMVLTCFDATSPDACITHNCTPLAGATCSSSGVCD